MSLCEADIGSLFRFDGQLIHVGAFHGTPAETEASRRPVTLPASHPSGQVKTCYASGDDASCRWISILRRLIIVWSLVRSQAGPTLTFRPTSASIEGRRRIADPSLLD